jgi:hypothetical protein
MPGHGLHVLLQVLAMILEIGKQVMLSFLQFAQVDGVIPDVAQLDQFQDLGPYLLSRNSGKVDILFRK